MTDEFNEPTDEEIGDTEHPEDAVEIGESEVQDLNAVLNFFSEVLATHEAAINAIAAAVFGGQDESQVPEQGSVDSADGDAKGDGEVIPVDFGSSDSTDAS